MKPESRAIGVPAEASAPQSAAGKLRIGISGWRYAPWRGHFYPPKLPQRQELAFASHVLPTIEINGSFYSLQRPSSYQRWHDETPAGFEFAVKGPRFVTHMLKLRDVEIALANFFASGVLALNAKLGPFLWQLPPQLPFDAARLEGFLQLLPRDTGEAIALAGLHDRRLDHRDHLETSAPHRLRHAIEVRHASYVDAAFVELLRRYDVALVVADTAGRWPLMEDVTADFLYLRLHGDVELYASGYGDEALAAWASRIDCWRHGRRVKGAREVSDASAMKRAARDVYCYFDNDAKVHAPYDAARLAARLGEPDALQPDGTFAPPHWLASRSRQRS